MRIVFALPLRSIVEIDLLTLSLLFVYLKFLWCSANMILFILILFFHSVCRKSSTNHFCSGGCKNSILSSIVSFWIQKPWWNLYSAWWHCHGKKEVWLLGENIYRFFTYLLSLLYQCNCILILKLCIQELLQVVKICCYSIFPLWEKWSTSIKFTVT